MDSYYYLSTSNDNNGTQYKINLDAMDFDLLPINKLMDKYQYQKASIKITIYNAKTRCKLNEVCKEEIRGNLLEYEVEVKGNLEDCVNNDNEECINHENEDSGNHEVEDSKDCRNNKIVSSGNHVIADSTISDETPKSYEEFRFLSNNERVHSNAKDRLLEAEAMMKTNAIFYDKNNKNKLWCKFCKIYFKSDDLFSHIEKSKTHVSQFQELNKLIEDEDISVVKYCQVWTQDKVYCCRCKVWVSCSYKCLEQHINGNNHVLLTAEYFLKRNAIQHVKNDNDQLWCKICNMYFKYLTYDDLYDHICNDSGHCNMFEKIDELIEGEDIDYDHFSGKEMVRTQYQVFCRRCNVWIQCNYECIKQHVFGFRHKHVK